MGKIHIITTQRVQLAACFEICKSIHLYYQDKYMRTAKIITFKFPTSNFLSFPVSRNDTQNFKDKEEWNSIKALSDAP